MFKVNDKVGNSRNRGFKSFKTFNLSRRLITFG